MVKNRYYILIPTRTLIYDKLYVVVNKDETIFQIINLVLQQGTNEKLKGYRNIKIKILGFLGTFSELLVNNFETNDNPCMNQDNTANNNNINILENCLWNNYWDFLLFNFHYRSTVDSGPA